MCYDLASVENEAKDEVKVFKCGKVGRKRSPRGRFCYRSGSGSSVASSRTEKPENSLWRDGLLGHL